MVRMADTPWQRTVLSSGAPHQVVGQYDKSIPFHSAISILDDGTANHAAAKCCTSSILTTREPAAVEAIGPPGVLDQRLRNKEQNTSAGNYKNAEESMRHIWACCQMDHSLSLW